MRAHAITEEVERLKEQFGVFDIDVHGAKFYPLKMRFWTMSFLKLKTYEEERLQAQ